jgi:4a-hydroxytetrahydrobiopterin dehydratase
VALLDDRAVADALTGTRWQRDQKVLRKVVKCAGFAGALAFVNAVGALAEAADHHPDINIRWDTVTLVLTTHSEGGLTQKDLDLAAAIDGVPA